MKIYVATHNAHKIREIKRILPAFDIIADDPEGVEETASDFIGNAFIKVRAVAARHPGSWCMADDSGLEVEALNGEPGVRSARYSGEDVDFARNNALLLHNMQGISNRRANFTCAIALVSPDGTEFSAIGKSFGSIADAPSGNGGFGYDPLFIPDNHSKSFAELGEDEKNAISHRGNALKEAVKIITSQKKSPLNAWFRLLRIVNLPTIPGDVLTGIAAASTSIGVISIAPSSITAAICASCCLYLYGLVDNDIAGAKTDVNRPIPNGEISLFAAYCTKFCFLALYLVAGLIGELPWIWWVNSGILFLAIALYNRLKHPFLMGVCRALNVYCGATVILGYSRINYNFTKLSLLAPVLIWLCYIAFVTKLSDGEEKDPARKALVGKLIGSIIYLQIAAITIFHLVSPSAITKWALVTEAVLLLALRLFKRLFRNVSAS